VTFGAIRGDGIPDSSGTTALRVGARVVT